MKVFWTREAEQDRIAIWEYIAADNPAAASRMDQLFSESSAKLTEFPTLGHAGLILGTLELIPHENYRLVYEVDNHNSTVWLLALVHTARRWPPLN